MSSDKKTCISTECPTGTVFNPADYKCHSCPKNTQYNPETKVCVSTICEGEMIFDY